ncbi:MAG: benzoyl-CoA-dihydrodiol lyase [Deltaproteobacteria bacterium]|nr:benzoyl-CoA-dihydrodiol lyase [Deltaproteobacteria bacterium]
MESATPQVHEPVRFGTHPSRYRHWKLSVEGPLARLVMAVDDQHPMREGYVLKLNSYDLGVDIELADAVQRLRFEHPEVRAVLVSSGTDNCFCAGANIYMLGSSTHAFKVNFCKFTNETRLYLEEASAKSGQTYVAALNGVASGGGYELALACEQIYLQDDGSSAVSFPETPLLAVLPGTGGLTRLVDKRKVRRDLADVFSTLAEGVRGKRAKDWGLVDDVFARSKFDAEVKKRAEALVAAAAPKEGGPAFELAAIEPERREEGGKLVSTYRFVEFVVDPATRAATLVVRAPESAAPQTSAELRAQGNDAWHLRAFRELDDALLDLRFNHPTVGLLLLKTEGDASKVKEHDAALLALGGDWLGREITLNVARVLRRLDLTARSLFATIEPGSCFVGTLFELALAADRSYMLASDEPDGPRLGLTQVNFGSFPMSNGLTRLATRFLARPSHVEALAGERDLLDHDAAMKLGLVTYAPDDIDWEDDVRIATEERASLSPDALTGMEANLRFAGPETMETKIFARLSAWQNWIFQRPNAVGERGALTMYGRPERPEFDWRRT